MANSKQTLTLEELVDKIIYTINDTDDSESLVEIHNTICSENIVMQSDGSFSVEN